MQKIAILGGGIGALATAAELTNDPNWQDNYEITIYQMGWRLGGKGASGRNRNMSDRIQEHGIHLWMGFYENAFHMIRQVYDEAHQKNLMPTSPFTDARKAFTPMNFTPMMEQVGSAWKQWDLNWWPSDAFPGEDSTFVNREQPPTPLGFVKMLLNRATAFLDEKEGQASDPGEGSTRKRQGTSAPRLVECRCCRPRQSRRASTRRCIALRRSRIRCLRTWRSTLARCILSWRSGSRTSTTCW